MYNRQCKTCEQVFETKHDFADCCPKCYFKAKNDLKKAEAQEPEKVESDPGTAAALNNIAAAIHALAVAVRGRK